MNILSRRQLQLRSEEGHDDTEWEAWIQRVAHEVEEQNHRYVVPWWVEEVRGRKSRWAAHVAWTPATDPERKANQGRTKLAIGR